MTLIPILWALSAALAFAFLTKIGDPPSAARTALKTAAVGGLALVAAVETGALLLIAALILSSLRATIIARHREGWLFFGFLAATVAHGVFAILFLNQEVALLRDPLRILLEITVLVLVGIGFWRMRGAERALKVSAGVYLVFLTAMTLFALGLPPELWPASLGALCILASDGLLAEELFGGARAPWRPSVGWVLLWCGYALISSGILYPRHAFSA